MSIDSFLSVHDVKLYDLLQNNPGIPGGSIEFPSLSKLEQGVGTITATTRQFVDFTTSDYQVVLIQEGDKEPFTGRVQGYIVNDRHGFHIEGQSLVKTFNDQDPARRYFSFGQPVSVTTGTWRFYRDYASYLQINLLRTISDDINKLSDNISKLREPKFVLNDGYYDVEFNDTLYTNRRADIAFYKLSDTVYLKVFIFQLLPEPDWPQTLIRCDVLPLDVEINLYYWPYPPSVPYEPIIGKFKITKTSS